MELKYLKNKLPFIFLMTVLAAVFLIFAGAPESNAKEKENIPPPRFYPAKPQKDSDIINRQDVEYPFTFIAYGDSREPSSEAKYILIERIIKEDPLFVIHLGDMVTYGEKEQWDIFDRSEGKIISAGIPFYPVPGNHEYYTSKRGYPDDPEEQIKHYFKRFTFLKERLWYSFKYGNSLFMILDTNTNYSKESPQHKWFMERLSQEKHEFLFIAFHHPPYTKNEKKSLRKSERFLAGILEGYKSRDLLKADIVFSSHTHNYERYLYGGINYVVSGGGGAPQYPVARDADDLYTGEGEVYHYCKITVSEKEAIFQMYKLMDDNSWKIADSFVIKTKK
ncbi:MAG: metallophosphoesterase [Candidatus Omnitrophota bacterium]